MKQIIVSYSLSKKALYSPLSILLVLVMVDAHRCLQPQARTTEDFLLDRLAKEKIPATLIFNKLDLIDENRELLQQVKERYLERYPYFKHTLYVSAVYEEGLEKVKVGNILCLCINTKVNEPSFFYLASFI